MKWQGWPRVKLRIPGGGDAEMAGREHEVEAIAPLIISASRSTDIPAFYGDWFMERVRKGYAKWINPWNGKATYVSFQNARVFVFWSKDPGPFLPHLAEMTRLGYPYLMLFTLNDYEAEGLEPRVPPLENRIRTFQAVSRMAGKGRISWRWDPLLLSDSLDLPGLMHRIGQVGDAVGPFTERLIFSFIDIARYPRVARNLRNRGFAGVRELSADEELGLAAGIRGMNRSWGLGVSACGEERNLSEFGIGPGECISRDRLLREFGSDPVLRRFLEPPATRIPPGEGNRSTPPEFLKDPGQRRACGCVVSKDIGEYATCPHLCAYCYANTSPDRVKKRYDSYVMNAGHGIFGESITGERNRF